MRSLKQIILLSAMAIALATGVTAQNDDQKRPPKEKPPVIDPRQKPPRENPPKGNDKPKKPGMSFFLVATDRDNNLA